MPWWTEFMNDVQHHKPEDVPAFLLGECNSYPGIKEVGKEKTFPFSLPFHFFFLSLSRLITTCIRSAERRSSLNHQEVGRFLCPIP